MKRSIAWLTPCGLAKSKWLEILDGLRRTSVVFEQLRSTHSSRDIAAFDQMKLVLSCESLLTGFRS